MIVRIAAECSWWRQVEASRQNRTTEKHNQGANTKSAITNTKGWQKKERMHALVSLANLMTYHLTRQLHWRDIHWCFFIEWPPSLEWTKRTWKNVKFQTDTKNPCHQRWIRWLLLVPSVAIMVDKEEDIYAVTLLKPWHCQLDSNKNSELSLSPNCLATITNCQH